MANGQAAPSSFASPNIFTAIGRRIRLWFNVAVWHVRAYLTTHAWCYRFLFAVLRKVRPILIMGKIVVVSRHEDVKAVLSRDADFILAEYSEERMLSGSFLLNIDWPNQHEYEETILLQALLGPTGDPCEPARRIKEITAEACQQSIVNARRDNNEIDVSGQLAERATLEVVKRYYGVPPPSDPEADMVGWLRDLASAILLLPPKGSRRRYKVENSAVELSDYLTRRICWLTRKIESELTGDDLQPLEGDDVLTRLLKLTVVPESDDRKKRSAQDWVRRYISGAIVFGQATIVRTATDAIDELLKIRRKRALADAAGTVRDLNQALEYREALDESSGSTGMADANLENLRISLKQYVYEALRFRPMLPVLFRYCPRVTVIAADRLRRRRIPAGAVVIAPPIAAMFDDRVFQHPHQFRIDRPLEDYLLFGAGLHECIGQFVADIQLTEIIKAVLMLPGLRRAPGDRGWIYYDGPAAKHLRLKFDDEPIGSEIGFGNE